MTIQELINELSKFPKEKFIKFYAWDDIEGENIFMNFNSLEDDEENPKCVNLYLE